MKKSKLSFEESMKRLDEIVRHLEAGDLPLEESLALFEEGTALIRSCSAVLDKAEQKVVLLRAGKNGSFTEEPFEGDVDP